MESHYCSMTFSTERVPTVVIRPAERDAEGNVRVSGGAGDGGGSTEARAAAPGVHGGGDSSGKGEGSTRSLCRLRPLQEGGRGGWVSGGRMQERRRRVPAPEVRGSRERAAAAAAVTRATPGAAQSRQFEAAQPVECTCRHCATRTLHGLPRGWHVSIVGFTPPIIGGVGAPPAGGGRRCVGRCVLGKALH